MLNTCNSKIIYPVFRNNSSSRIIKRFDMENMSPGFNTKWAYIEESEYSSDPYFNGVFTDYCV